MESKIQVQGESWQTGLFQTLIIGRTRQFWNQSLSRRNDI